MFDRVFQSIRPKTSSPTKKVRSGDAKIIRIGRDRLVFRDLYVNLLSMSWLSLVLLIASIYISLNLIFASLYYLNIGGIDQAHSFIDAFFFSVQTFSTIGYGHMAPVSMVTNILTTIEVLAGFISFAFITGLMFTKFSKPTAHVLFSEVAVISNFEGKQHLKIRLANKRNNRIVDATARMFLLRYVVTKEGFPIRRFIDLPVIRDHMPILRLTWTLMHPIDENSPLFGMSQKDMESSDDELFVTMVGLDETLAQTIHARYSYFPDEIIHGAYFRDVVKRNRDSVELDYNVFHSVRFDVPNAEQEDQDKVSNGEGRSAAAG